jgi:ATP-dependent DNA ligase
MAATLKALNTQYPELVEALERQTAERFIADGEVVAFENGQTSFARLQGRMQLSNPDAARRTGIAVFLYLFDLPQQELVIVGFTDPRGSRRGLGALLVGHYDRGSLRYAGKVGTGFSEATLERLRERLERRERGSSPLDGGGIRERGVHWVRPELVAEIGFTEWTRDGRLRHPRYLGLRTDKPARKVVRERPTALGARSR